MTDRLDRLETRVDLLQTTQNQIREALVEHREGIAKLAKLVPAVGTLAQELGELVHYSGLPTTRTLQAGREPGQPGTMAHEIVEVQVALEEVTVQFAALDARLRVIVEAGKASEPWSPSKLQRKIDQAQEAAIATMRATQEAARARAGLDQGEEPTAGEEGQEVPLPRVNGARPTLDLSAFVPPTKDENQDG